MFDPGVAPTSRPATFLQGKPFHRGTPKAQQAVANYQLGERNFNAWLSVLRQMGSKNL